MSDVTWDDIDDSVTWDDTDADVTWNATTISTGGTTWVWSYAQRVG